MAGSRQDHLRRDPFQRPTLTPGPLGYNDAASPNSKALPKDTPGPVGRNDLADPSARYNAPQAVLRISAPERWIPLDQAQIIALEISTYFEGGEAKYGTLADDGDDQATSFGLLQWNFGQNTLGPILKKMLRADPGQFENCFTKNTGYETLKKAILENDQAGQKKWARSLLKTNRSGWETSFKNIARVAVFNKIQNDEAIKDYHMLVMRDIAWLRAIKPIEFQRIEINTYAALFDLCVQQYGIGKSKAAIISQIGEKKPKTQGEIMAIVVMERGRGAKHKYQADCISRRMGILTSEPFISTEGGGRVTRKNPKFKLLVHYRGAYVRL
ncbi:hypothetical protein KP004_18860 [Geomonas oryzisoli]|uniref:Uncharacterized protein n=1 Tax=Geomonas oryzisoli TaxID=2847992 RepID=A0ABX8J807_9BACT|nr:hypothetical protein [Geomonas oryzisoli]QWV93202.1 hypothetical protein KP004_18860 [Geomonas oryzisoli]